MPEEATQAEGAGEVTATGGWRNWLAGHRGWFILAVLTVAQGLFTTVLLFLKTEVKRSDSAVEATRRHLSPDSARLEVMVKDITQYIRIPGGKHMTIGMDLVVVLGELPEERADDVMRPNGGEMQAFAEAVTAMEPAIRDRVNAILLRVPPGEYGNTEVQDLIRKELADYVNDRLEALDFPKLRPEIGKRRVVAVFLPQFVRQVV